MKKAIERKRVFEFIYILLGVSLGAFAFSFFLNPRNIVVGGVVGLGVIIKHYVPTFDPALTIFVLNLFLLFLGFLLLGKDFLIKTALGSIAFPLFIYLFDLLYIALDIDSQIQSLDMVVVVLFASVISGIGFGIVLKLGGTTGGSEVIQKIMHKYLNLPFSISIYIIDGLVILLGLFLGVSTIQTFLYAIILVAISGQVIDTVVYSGFNRRAVYIISKKNDEIKVKILEDIDRGVTSMKVIGGYTKQEQDMLLCVLNTSEYNHLRKLITDIDPNAFYFAVRANEVTGEGFTYE